MANPFFWQPRRNYLQVLTSTKNGFFLVMLNYSIWYFLAFISFLLIAKSPSLFWSILLATILAEIIEKIGKKTHIWRRPVFAKNPHIPTGLVEEWYKTGSFPSGHTIKTTFFFFFILQFAVINPVFFLAISLPLIIFRVLIGFHYPIDIIGGLIIGLFIWLFVSQITIPVFLADIIKIIFNSIFYVV